jgi:DNA-binding NarL/FixJ family response regulator
VVLESVGHRVVTAESVQTGTDALREEFDVAVFDVDLPDGKGFELVDLLRKNHSAPTPVVMITGNPNEESLARSVSHGITEFLFKPFDRSELTDAVARALEAKERWNERVATLKSEGRVAESSDATSPEELAEREVSQLLDGLAARNGLTERERETLKLMLEGLQNADIADVLQISANTVKYHVRNVLTKLGMESRTELFRSLLNHGET